MRAFICRLVVAALVLLRWAAPLLAQVPPSQAPALEAVASIGITVGDLDRSLDFYIGVLGFEKISEVEVTGAEYERLTGVFGVRLRIARLKLGLEEIELTQYLAPEGRAVPVDSRGNDRWFQHFAIVVRNMDSAYAALRAHRIRHASTGPQLLPNSNPNAGGIRAFYFKDPDGHFLEAIWFPEGKGNPRWRAFTDRLFLGIDHTAIVVEDTDRALAFYRGLLGFTVGGQSRNYGTEQEHLNNVEGASLLITGLRLAQGPGVEFLEYLTPKGGRPYPADARPNDLIHWHTTLSLPRGAGLDLLATSGSPLISRGVASIGSGLAVMIADPDGHVVQLIQP